MCDDWIKAVSQCFGSVDKKFALHPSDEEAAFQWLGSLRQKGTTWNDARGQISAYLTGQGCNDTHIDEQLDRAQQYLLPWLKVVLK